MSSSNDKANLTTHLLTMLSVASGMVGVCATAIGLVGIVKKMNSVETLVDDFFAVGSLLFLFVSGLAFLGLRTKLASKWSKLVPTIDVTFVLGLAVVALASVFLTYMVI